MRVNADYIATLLCNIPISSFLSQCDVCRSDSFFNLPIVAFCLAYNAVPHLSIWLGNAYNQPL